MFSLRSSCARKAPATAIKSRFTNTCSGGQRGERVALRQIGFHYTKSWGVIRDLTKANMWFTLAAQEGNNEALENCQSIAYTLSETQIANAEAMVARWLETHEWEIETGSFGG